LTGDITGRCLLIFCGGENSGKSAVMSILNAILGQKLCLSVDENIFAQLRNKINHNSIHIGLKCKRVCVLNDAEKEGVLNMCVLKGLVGNNIKKSEQFSQTHKPILLTNDKPNIDVNNVAMIDRINMIQFDAKIPADPQHDENKKYSELVERLLSDKLSEVFSWMVRGSIKFYAEGMGKNMPDEVAVFLNGYSNNISAANEFLENMCEVKEGEKLGKALIFGAYSEWCISNSKANCGRDNFYDLLERKGIQEIKINGNYYYKNISFREPEDDAE